MTNTRSMKTVSFLHVLMMHVQVILKNVILLPYNPDGSGGQLSVGIAFPAIGGGEESLKSSADKLLLATLAVLAALAARPIISLRFILYNKE